MYVGSLEGKHTIDTIAKTKNITRQSAINLISKLKKQKLVNAIGGGRQKRIYTIYKTPTEEPNGFYTIVNKYAPDKLVPRYKHYVHGTYTIENAIIDGLVIGDTRTLQATMHLFRHVTNWKLLFKKAREHNKEKELTDLYQKARKIMRVRRMPKRYT